MGFTRRINSSAMSARRINCADRALARESPAGFRLATSSASRAHGEARHLSNPVLTAKPAIPTHRFLGFFKKPSPWDSEQPIREELFSVERLEAHAKSLAVAQTVASRPTRGLSLAARLANNSTVLLSSYRSIVKAIDDGRQITPAGEWLIDNFHLVERQIRQISTDLPPGYYRQLPKLVTGPFAGYPRVFGLAWAFVAHTDSCFDSEILVSYVNAYQEVQPLTIGELWAVSITLQIVLIENLRRLAHQITSSRDARHEADRLADRLLGVNGRAPEPASVVFAGRGAEPLSEAFAVELVHRLRDQDPRFTPALAWLDERARETGPDCGFGRARSPSQPRGRERYRPQHRDEPEGDRRG